MAGGINLYAYVSNNPINGIDPLGLILQGIPAVAYLLEAAGVAAGVTAVGVSGAIAGGGFLGDVLYDAGSRIGESCYTDVYAIDPFSGIMYVYPDNAPFYEAKKTEKEKASDIPSWAKGERPLPGESGNDFADRVLDKKYGKGNYPKGPGSEHNKIKKYGDRSKKR